MQSITFETKCYEKDWEFIIKKRVISEMISNCNTAFDKKKLFINNVSNPTKVLNQADLLVSEGIIDEYVFVENYEKEALDFFELKKEDFKGGYYYSIAELVSIYLCDTDFLLHFASDSMLYPNNGSWIQDAINLMLENSRYATASATPHADFNWSKKESIGENDKFYLNYGFSDQCYLVKTSEFRKPIYSFKHEASERYPTYGGELFEKRVDSYLRVNDKVRLTSKIDGYKHENWPKNFFKMKIKLISS